MAKDKPALPSHVQEFMELVHANLKRAGLTPAKFNSIGIVRRDGPGYHIIAVSNTHLVIQAMLPPSRASETEEIRILRPCLEPLRALLAQVMGAVKARDMVRAQERPGSARLVSVTIPSPELVMQLSARYWASRPRRA